MRWTDHRWAVFGAVLALAVAGAFAPAQAQIEIGYPPIPGYPPPPGYHDCDSGCGEVMHPGADVVTRVIRGEGARYENVVVGPAGEAELVRAIVEAEGGRIVRVSPLGSLGQISQIILFPNSWGYERAQAEIARQTAASSLDRHHAYAFAQARRAPRLYAPMLIGDAAPGRCRVTGPVTIGMIDGPVNTEHPALRGVDITFETLVSRGRVPNAHHGTAVAQLLVGEDEGGALAGFARGARLHAISVFSQRDAGEEAGVERIAEAIDRLVRGGVRLINLSIAGPENAALSRVLAAAADRGAILIAASGNNRRPQVSWPAAAPEVIAVTAIDAARQRFNRANTGLEVEFAAPGVDVYAARSSGGGYVSGTSFAAPIVTALAARYMAGGDRTTAAIRARLQAGVQPLGPGQRNAEFGWGLVQSNGC